MLSSPEQSFMLRPQRVSFCCARRRIVNPPREDCSRLEVSLINKAGQSSRIFRVRGTRRSTLLPHSQTPRIPCFLATGLRRRHLSNRSIVELFTSRCMPLQITPAPTEPLLFSSSIHSTARQDPCTPRKSFSSHWMPIWLSCQRAIPRLARSRVKREFPRSLVLSSWPERGPLYQLSGPLTTTVLCI